MSITFKVAAGTISLSAMINVGRRFIDRVEGEDSFAQHTNRQHRKHFISGMHEPYTPNKSQQDVIQRHFSEFQHLIPSSPEEISGQSRLKSPVHIKRLSECPVKKETVDFTKAGTVVVGGPPALISSAFEQNLTYINDGRRRPIAFGSAFHLEWDAESEAPTTSQPLHFMIDQIKRVIFPEWLATTEKTGHSSWKSLDWDKWIKNPSKWSTGIRIAIAFQQFTQSGPHPSVNEEVANRTKKNQHFYELLHAESNQKLFMPGEGSVYVARTDDERNSLLQMRDALKKENRKMQILSSAELLNRFNYFPKGVLFGEKTHDRVLSPHFLSLLSERIVQKLNGKVIDACVTTIYTDDPDTGGILAYQAGEGAMQYIPFKKLVMSLGTQQILGVDNAPLFDIVAARGVSTIALAYLPKEATLPPAVVCGATNHVAKLAGPIPFEGKNLFLLRMTCGACITPNSDSADYDGVAAVGLKKSVEDVLKGRVEIFTAYGCNRQVSQYGQTHWLKVSKTLRAASSILTPRGGAEDIGTSLPNSSSGIFIQYGAGGGGLTQAPAQS